MNVILDECLPRRLVRDLPAHAVTTVPKQGWASLANGELLRLIEPEFDIFITIDKNMSHQQNLANLKICLIVLHASNRRYETLQPLVPEIRSAVDQAQPGTVIHIDNYWDRASPRGKGVPDHRTYGSRIRRFGCSRRLSYPSLGRSQTEKLENSSIATLRAVRAA